jgi:O-antigen/teichoic acid export membrane protein
LSQEDWTSVREEYHQSRVLALIVALVGGAFLSVFGGEVLGWFGEYSAAHSILQILAATYIVHVSFGMCGGYLNIAGYGGWTLITTALVLLTNVVLNYLLIPVIGGEGAAVAMFVSFVLTNLLTVYLVKRLDDVQTYSLWLGGITGIAASALGAAAYGVIPPWGTSLVLLIIVGKLVVNEITFLRALAHSVVGAVPFRI